MAAGTITPAAEPLVQPNWRRNRYQISNIRTNLAAGTITPAAEPLVQPNWRRNRYQISNIRTILVVSS